MSIGAALIIIGLVIALLVNVMLGVVVMLVGAALLLPWRS